MDTKGTGTKAGDPLELEGIAKTICSTRKQGNDLIVGSVKSNVCIRPRRAQGWLKLI